MKNLLQVNGCWYKMLVLQILEMIIIFLFVWITSFLLHELCHIKSQGIKNTGNIYIHKLSMTASCPITNIVWFHYSGGILTCIVMFLMSIFLQGWWCWCYLTLGWVHLCYGIYEGYNMGSVSNRYMIYILVLLVMLILWSMRWWLYVVFILNLMLKVYRRMNKIWVLVNILLMIKTR